MTRVDTKVISRILFALIVSVSLVAAFSLANPAQILIPSWAQQNKPLKVALLTDALFSDGGWGAVAYNASQVLKGKYGLELSTQEKIH